MTTRNLEGMAPNDVTATLREAMRVAQQNGDYDLYDAIQLSDTMLTASLTAKHYSTHPAQAHELLQVDTVARRRRVLAEAHTLSNLIGGVLSGCLCNARQSLARLITEGREADEMYGERTAREYREREADLRAVTGNPAAIYYPPQMRR